MAAASSGDIGPAIGVFGSTATTNPPPRFNRARRLFRVNLVDTGGCGYRYSCNGDCAHGEADASAAIDSKIQVLVLGKDQNDRPQSDKGQ
jgi:hypothetical protein